MSNKRKSLIASMVALSSLFAGCVYAQGVTVVNNSGHKIQELKIVDTLHVADKIPQEINGKILDKIDLKNGETATFTFKDDIRAGLIYTQEYTHSPTLMQNKKHGTYIYFNGGNTYDTKVTIYKFDSTLDMFFGTCEGQGCR